MTTYDTVTEAVNNLLERGYNNDFNQIEDGLQQLCHNICSSLPSEDFMIDEVHRFEGMTDPADQPIVYAVSSKKFNIKGIVVNGYGVYADSTTSAIVQNLSQFNFID